MMIRTISSMMLGGVSIKSRGLMPVRKASWAIKLTA